MKIKFLLFVFIFLSASIVCLYIKGLLNTDQRILQQQKALSFLENTFTDFVVMNEGSFSLSKSSVQTEHLDSINIGSVFQGSEYKLLVYLNEKQCISCIDTILSNLSNNEKGIGVKNILILSSYHKIREVMTIKKMKSVDYRILNIAEHTLPEAIRGKTAPVLFIMNNDLTPRHIFFANKDYPEFNELYIQAIEKAFRKKYIKHNPIVSPKVTSIKLMDTLFQFDTVALNAPAIADFKFVNTGLKPLVIASVVTGCGCTSVDYPHYAIAPGDTSAISVKYDTSIAGVFERTAYVYSNAMQSPQRIRIMGVVKN